MNLDETQKATVREWIQAGVGLSEIQSKLDSEFGVSVTYMEVRFLVDDLGVVPKDPEPEPEPDAEAGTDAGAQEAGVPEPAADSGMPEAPAPAESGMPPGNGMEGEPDAGGGGVSVTVDQITRAGALASGKVTFSDGNSAAWSLDQMGRLGLSADDPGYKPSQQDVMEFQVQLQRKLSGPGF